MDEWKKCLILLRLLFGDHFCCYATHPTATMSPCKPQSNPSIRLRQCAHLKCGHRCESPGPYVTMGRFMAFPKMFMSPVPVLCRSVAGLFSTLRTDEDSTWTSGEALLTSNGSTVSRTVAFTDTFGLAAWYFAIIFSICSNT